MTRLLTSNIHLAPCHDLSHLTRHMYHTETYNDSYGYALIVLPPGLGCHDQQAEQEAVLP